MPSCSMQPSCITTVAHAIYLRCYHYCNSVVLVRMLTESFLTAEIKPLEVTRDLEVPEDPEGVPKDPNW